MMINARQRILQFLQLTRCVYQQNGNRIVIGSTILTLTEQEISIDRAGKPQRTMPYRKLNLDRLLYLINAQTERKRPV